MNNWIQTSLNDLIDIIGGGTPKTSVQEYWNGDIPWLSVVDFNNNAKYVQTTEKCITKKGLDNSSTRILNKGDIIISARGTVGAIAVLASPMAFNQSCYGIRPKSNKIHRDFLYYITKNSFNDFHQVAYGSVFDTITRDSFKEIQIYLPPLPEQKAIASLLSSLDDKIDLLHRQNKTLEAMADDIFYFYFLENPNQEWKQVSLTLVANFLNGLACQKYPPKNSIDSLPVLKIRELNNGISSDSDVASTDINSEYIIENGNIIFSWSGSLLVKIWFGEKCILNQHLYKVTSNIYHKWFYYQWCKYHLQNFIAIADSKATTMGHIKRSDLDNAKVIVPDCNTISRLNLLFDPLINKIIANNRQINKLMLFREMLLPNLMSGEVRVNF
jgi:type I restriction enzyme S subunit